MDYGESGSNLYPHPSGGHCSITEKSFAYQPRSAKAANVQYNRNGLLSSYEGADGLKNGTSVQPVTTWWQLPSRANAA